MGAVRQAGVYAGLNRGKPSDLPVTHEVRPGVQPQDRQDAWLYRAEHAARPRRQGD